MPRTIKDLKFGKKKTFKPRKALYQEVISEELADIFSRIDLNPDLGTQNRLNTAGTALGGGMNVLPLPQQRNIGDIDFQVPRALVPGLIKDLSKGALEKLFEGDHVAAATILQRVRGLEDQHGVQSIFKRTEDLDELQLILDNIETLAQQLPGIRVRLLELEHRLRQA